MYSKKTPTWSNLLFGLLAAAVFFCCEKKIESEEIVATVGNAVLTRSDLRQKLLHQTSTADSESGFVMQWVHRELMYQEAKKLNLDQDKALEAELERVEKEFLVNKLLEKTFENKIQVTEEQIADYYAKNTESFRLNRDEMRGYHILTTTRTNADLARRSLNAGTPFAEVAKEYSTGLFRDHGGDMGFFGEDDVIPEVWRTAERAGIDEISRVFTSPHGFHILKITEKREKGSVIPLAAVRNDIKFRLRVSKERAAYYDLIFNLENRQQVYVNVPRNEQ